MRLFVGANPVRVMASGAIDVNHKDEVYDGKVDLMVSLELHRLNHQASNALINADYYLFVMFFNPRKRICTEFGFIFSILMLNSLNQ